jgi:hypothetical protein
MHSCSHIEEKKEEGERKEGREGGREGGTAEVGSGVVFLDLVFTKREERRRETSKKKSRKEKKKKLKVGCLPKFTAV